MERLTKRCEKTGAASISMLKNDCCDCICGNYENCGACPIDPVINKLADYEDAEELGRMLRLPAEKGNILYRIAGIEILEECVYDIVLESVGRWSIYNDLGKTVFLTREDAQAALSAK